MKLLVVGSGRSYNISQNKSTYFANSSVVRCTENTILNGVVSAGILETDEILQKAPVQNFKDSKTAFELRKNKREEILKRKYKNLYIIGSLGEKKRKLKFAKNQAMKT